MRAQGKQFAYPNTHYAGNELADDGIPWLRQWRFNGIEVQNRPGALIIEVSVMKLGERVLAELTKLAMMMGA